LYGSPHIIRVIRSRRITGAGHAARMSEMRNAYKMFGKTKGKRLLGRVRRIWEDNTRMDPREIGWEGVNWMHLDQDGDHWRASVNMVINVWVPQKAENVWSSVAFNSYRLL